jgi:hypothetical protein
MGCRSTGIVEGYDRISRSSGMRDSGGGAGGDRGKALISIAVIEMLYGA